MQLGPRRKREPTWFMEIEDRSDCLHCLRLSITSSKVRGPAVVSNYRAGSEASPRRGIASFADRCRKWALRKTEVTTFKVSELAAALHNLQAS